jgi:lipid-A-disaccharide synthase
MSNMNRRHILIVAGEASGDLHGAALVREIKKLDPTVSVQGIGGKRLAEAGVDILVPSSELAVVGLTEVFSKLSKIYQARRDMRRLLKLTRPDLLILIDFPDFNISLARTAKHFNVPVLYYVSPQLWAWRSGRAKKLAARIDKMAVILPFEKEFYRKTGVDIDVEYVGHPLMDAIPSGLDGTTISWELGLVKGGPVIGLLPGSRTAEIKNILPSMLGAAEILSEHNNNLQFILPLASTITKGLIDSFIDRTSLKIIVSQKDIYSILGVCDLALVASGTATLETALMGVPMVVAYRVSPLSFRIGKMVVKTPHVSLVNLIAGGEIVPELLQDDVTPQKLAERASAILENDAYRREMIVNLKKVKESIGGRGASEKTARIAMSLINKAGEGE